MPKKITLTQGKIVIVDDEDYDWIRQWKWCAAKDHQCFYAVRGIWIKGTYKAIRMHRQILNPPPNKEVDHINGDGLDNRRCNLRISTRSQNGANQRAQQREKTSQYKGVRWCKEVQKYRAYIKVNGRQKHLGYFNSEEVAAQVYNKFATEYFGEFARLNF